MILGAVDLSNKNTNVVQLPEPVLVDTLPPEVREILVQPMGFPKNAAEQEIFAENDVLMERLGASGTIVYIPDCDRLTHRTAKTLVDHATKEMARIYPALPEGRRKSLYQQQAPSCLRSDLPDGGGDPRQHSCAQREAEPVGSVVDNSDSGGRGKPMRTYNRSRAAGAAGGRRFANLATAVMNSYSLVAGHGSHGL